MSDNRARYPIAPITEIVARKVIAVAGTGERDPERIRDLVLLGLKESGEAVLSLVHRQLVRCEAK